MFGRLRIRGKLALVVAVPLVAMALLTLPTIFNAINTLQRAEQIERSMQIADRVTALAFEIQQERLLSLGYLFDVVDREQLARESRRVDDRLADIRHAVSHGELREQGLPEPVSTAVGAAEDLLSRRDVVLDRTAVPEQVYGEYSQAIGQLIDSLQLLDGADMATPAAQHVAVYEASLGMNEASAQAGNLLVMIAATGSEFAGIMYAVALTPLGDHFDQYVKYATRDQQLLRDQMEQAYIDRASTGEGALPFDPYEGTAGLSVAELFQDIQSLGHLGRFVEGKIITDVLIEVESQRQAALNNVYLVALGGLLVLLTVVAITALLGRTVVRPLLGLTDSANRVARLADAELARIADDESAVLMPEPIRIGPVHVGARDEIGDLGRAFERVQAFAIQLVERQMTSRRNVALMLGYLGRRTQNLVGRQLDLIDSLERNETDTNRLAKLYRLDHVSSRLRRNADSLVVLSGASGPAEHATPLPLADIVRLALGEIEAYERVDIEVPPTVAVAPAVIGDLVLVLAELMENATIFSPPHTRVTVSAIATGRRAPGDHLLEILVVDHGIGLPADRRAEENARLAHRERLDLAPTEVLGLFVVGRLARRHGLRVTLSETAGGGVTAAIALYREHLVSRETLGSAVSSRGGDERALETSAQPGEQALPPSEQPPPSGRELGQLPGPSLQPGGVDLEVLHRATRVLETGQPWNAFAKPAAAEPRDAEPRDAEPRDAEPRDAAAPAAEPPAAAAPVAWPPAPAEPPAAAAPIAEPPAPAEPLPATGSVTSPLGLRRRVPGATLALSPATRRPRPGQPAANRRPSHPSAASDPAQARELVEQLESGVMRALSEMQSLAEGPHAGIRGERDDQ